MIVTKKATRIACLYVPSFALAGRRLDDPTLAGRPHAVIGPGGEREGVREVSPEARALGVRRGQTPVQARAVCPEIAVLPFDPAADERHARRVVEALRAEISPLVEMKGASGIFFADLRGTEALHGGETRVLEKLREIAARLGFDDARTGVADERFAAFAAASVDDGRGASGVRVPERGSERFLGTLPLGRLPLPGDLGERLAALGIDTVGEFAALPAASVERRYGVEGLSVHRLARGEDVTPIDPARAEATVEAEFDLGDAPCEGLEEIRPAIESLLTKVLSRLAAEGRAARAIAGRFDLADGSAREWTIAPARPTARFQTLAALSRLSLESAPPLSAPVEGVRLRVTATAPAPAAQRSLFCGSRRAPDPAKVEEVVADLRRRYGDGAVARPALGDAVRPEARRRFLPFFHEEKGPAAAPSSRSAAAGPEAEESGENDRPLVPALKLFDPAIPLEVSFDGARLAEVSFVFVRLGACGDGAPRARTRLRIASLEGPERISGDWWDDEGAGLGEFARDYFEARGSHGGGLYWIYRDLRDSRYYLHGLFD